ncbi:hypothetical protein F5Y01DRAFT_317378 [Xylaria sp. FL0043]|nr:hypothetical protein F5Y01DRAFT_317378 [Xylaria sp. FL0043]
MANSSEGADSGTSRRYSCSLCLKNFENEASAKRHYYYCRSKPSDSKRSRKSACIACVRAKARCSWRADADLSGCLRCNKRGIACEYDATATRRIVPDKAGENSNPAAVMEEGQSNSVEESCTALISIGSASHDETNQTYLNMEPAAELTYLDTLNFNFEDVAFDIGQFQSEKMNSMSVACSKIARLSSKATSPPPPWAYPLPKTPLFSIRAFERPDHVALQTIAIRILKSYPFMMRAKGALPPFIHFSVYARSRSGDGHEARDSLLNCWNLVQSFKSQNSENKGSWVWGRIWYEEERIRAEYSTFDRWQLLDALQALLIFCLLRLQDVPVGHAVFDVSLLTTVNLVSQALASSVDEYFDCSIAADPTLARKDWIFIESRRRTVLVFQILGLLVDISTAVSYFTIGGLVLVPLPSSTALWSTQDFERWKPEFKKWYKERSVCGLSETGSLVKLQDTDHGLRTNMMDWESWSAEVGDIATLVMIIGEILKNR